MTIPGTPATRRARKFCKIIMSLTGPEVRFMADRTGMDLRKYDTKEKQAIVLCMIVSRQDYTSAINDAVDHRHSRWNRKEYVEMPGISVQQKLIDVFL